MVDYFRHPGISNSQLTTINPEQGGSPKKFQSFYNQDFEKKDSLSLERGSLLHKWIEDPLAFQISDIVKPKDPVGKIVEMYHSLLSEGENDDDVLYQAAMLVGYGAPNWKKETVINKIKEAGALEYLNALRLGEDKHLLTSETANILNRAYAAIQQNAKAVELLFHPDSFVEHEIYHTYNQWINIDNWAAKHELTLKAKIDNFHIDHDRMTVVVKDLKTTGKPVYLFRETLEFWR
jgi:hypothetical protein